MVHCSSFLVQWSMELVLQGWTCSSSSRSPCHPTDIHGQRWKQWWYHWKNGLNPRRQSSVQPHGQHGISRQSTLAWVSVSYCKWAKFTSFLEMFNLTCFLLSCAAKSPSKLVVQKPGPRFGLDQACPLRAVKEGNNALFRIVHKSTHTDLNYRKKVLFGNF